MTNNWSWLKIDASGEAVIANTSLEDYLSGLGYYVHCVALPCRPGVTESMTVLEQRHFPPGTPANDKYCVTVVNWQNVQWFIMSIPGSYLETAKKLLGHYNLRLVEGRPAIITESQRLGFGEVAPLDAFPSAAVVTVSHRFLDRLQKEYDPSEYTLFPVTHPRMYTMESNVKGKHIAGVLLFPDQDIGDRVGRG